MLHRKITDAEQRIQNLEIEATQVLVARVRPSPSRARTLSLAHLCSRYTRLQVLESYDSLLQTADALAELDVVLGFAEVAEENGWVRPDVDTRCVPASSSLDSASLSS